MKNFIYALMATIALSTYSLPAFAVDAEGAVKTCNKNKNCKITITDIGETNIVVNGELISCPLVGECQCVTCEPQEKSVKTGVKKDIMSVPKLLKQGAVN